MMGSAAWAVVANYVVVAPTPAPATGAGTANFSVTFTGTPSADATVACTKTGTLALGTVTGTPITTTSTSPVTIGVPYTGAVAADTIACTITPGTGDTVTTNCYSDCGNTSGLHRGGPDHSTRCGEWDS